MMPLEHGKGGAALAQSQGDAAGMLNHPRGDADDLLHHRLDTPPLGGMAHRTVRADQSRLSNGAQDIEGQHGQRQHQIVGGELAGRQTFQVQVVLDSEWNCSCVPCPW